MTLTGLLRVFSGASNEVLLRLYTTYVRPLVEYVSPVWSPPEEHRLSRKLEYVQKRLLTVDEKQYHKRLATLGLLTLQNRRRRADLIEVYKTLHNLDTWNGSAFAEADDHRPSTRSTTERLLQQRLYSSTMRRKTFEVRATADWNNLPLAVREQKTLGIFKRRLDRYLMSQQNET
eukprot:Selendium_serpulae@DN5387_c0_g1_i3.p1